MTAAFPPASLRQYWPGGSAIFRGLFNTFAVIAALAMLAAGGWVLTRDGTRTLTNIGWTIRAPETPIKVATEKPAVSPYYTTPQLRIEAGMHVGKPTALAVDIKRQFAVTAGYDATVRVWALPKAKGGELELVDVLRVPIGDGNVGKIYALALSPDGRTVAVGGWMSYSNEIARDRIFLVDRKSGRITFVYSDSPRVTNSLAFSKDGNFLAAGLGVGGGLVVLRTKNGSIEWMDADYQGSIYGLSYDNQGRLAVSSLDGSIRLYDPFGRRIARIPAPDGESPSTLSFNNNGSILAVGYSDCTKHDCAGAITLFDTSDASGFRRLRMLTPNSPTGHLEPWLSEVAWSTNGRYLFAGGAFTQLNAKGSRALIRFDTTNSYFQEYFTALRMIDSLFSISAFGDDGAIILSRDPAIGAIDGSGDILFRRGGSARDFRIFTNSRDIVSFRLANDGSHIDIPGDSISGQLPLRFDVFSRHAIETIGPDPNLAGPCDQVERHLSPGSHCPKSAEYKVTGWDYGLRPVLVSRAGTTVLLKLAANDTSRSLALAPDGQQFVLGTDFSIALFDSTGKSLRRVSVPDAAWRVNITPDGRFLVVGLYDGTIRWYSLEKGRELTELLALFISEPTPEFKQRRWVLWTPSGYYDASPGGEDLLGWHLNRGGDQSALFYPAGRFRDLYRRPDIIDQVLCTRRVPPPPPTEAFNTLIPPVLRILDVEQKGSAKVRVQYQLDWPLNSKRQVATLSGSVNGVTTRIGGAALSSDKDTGSIDLFVPAGSGPREISLSATTPEAGISEPAIRRIDNLKPTPGAGPGVLHALLVGVADYKDPAFRLTYAADDVKAIQAALARQKASGLYTDVRTAVLADAEATRGKILAAMREIAAAEGPNDTTILFLAGHGATQLAPRRIGAQSVDTMTYYFLPHDGVVRDGKVDPATAISQFDITLGFLGKIEGRKAVFLDTCRFGKTPGQGQRGLKVVYANEFERRLGSLLAATLGDKGWASVVYAASSDAEAALESSRFRNGHGAFTAALLDGLDGDPRLRRDAKGRFDQKQLGDWFELRVPEITGNQQAPVRADSSGPAFPFGSVVK